MLRCCKQTSPPESSPRQTLLLWTASESTFFPPTDACGTFGARRTGCEQSNVARVSYFVRVVLSSGLPRLVRGTDCDHDKSAKFWKRGTGREIANENQCFLSFIAEGKSELCT